jgi:hypothetical protein
MGRNHARSQAPNGFPNPLRRAIASMTLGRSRSLKNRTSGTWSFQETALRVLTRADEYHTEVVGGHAYVVQVTIEGLGFVHVIRAKLSYSKVE